MPSKITRIINRPLVGYDAFYALHEIPPDIIANKGFAEGVMFKINPQTGEPMLTQGGDFYLTDAGLKIVQQEGELRDNIANAFTQSPEVYTAKDVDPGRQAWEKKVYAPQSDPWNDPDQRALEVVTRQYQQTNAAIPRRTNPDLGEEISREEFYSRQKNKQGIRPSAHASQMGVPTQPVPGTSSELPLEGSSSNSTIQTSVMPGYQVIDGPMPNLAKVISGDDQIKQFLEQQAIRKRLLEEAQVQQAVQEQAGKAAAGSNAQDVKQQAAAIQKETSPAEPGNTPWWKNPWTYGKVALAGAGFGVGSLLMGAGSQPSYEEEMMMRAQYGQMPSSFDDRYGYY